jgi:hypothetical protein
MAKIHFSGNTSPDHHQTHEKSEQREKTHAENRPDHPATDTSHEEWAHHGSKQWLPVKTSSTRDHGMRESLPRFCRNLQDFLSSFERLRDFSD